VPGIVHTPPKFLDFAKDREHFPLQIEDRILRFTQHRSDYLWVFVTFNSFDQH
jgi:hypothetical protein